VLDGKDITHLPIHERARMGLSYLPQEASVFRKLNVAENIQAVLELQVQGGKPLSKAEIANRLDELLGELQIGHLRNNPALSLSGGERRRVEIARALASQPKFILLDEPFAGVDPIAVGEIQRIVRFLRDRQIGICDHAYIISEGSVLAEGQPDQIIENDAVRRVYLGENFRM
jgi:lipopolysaccharide export system ATP-binding protein